METQSEITRSVPEQLEINRRAWNIVAPAFAGGCALPHWGPFGERRSLNLLGTLEGATVLKAGCGSGHSIGRVLALGAKHVYGIDFSSRQIALAADLNRMQIDSGCVRLIEAPMEEPLGLNGIDAIFSIQAIGWTRDPVATFGHFASYLRPGGRLVWSWGHPLFHKVRYQDGKLVLADSYFNEHPQFTAGWSGSDGAIIQTRTIATWFRHLSNAGFTVREYLELEAEILPDSARDPHRYYSEVTVRAVPSTVVFICERGSSVPSVSLSDHNGNPPAA